MQKNNIFKQMYNLSPMNFYTFGNEKTTIKSVNNTSLGYEFNRIFTPEDIRSVWFQIKLHKRISTILIFLLFIYLLYEIIFPQYSFLVNNSWYVNAIIMLVVIGIVCQVITVICTKIFEKSLNQKFGEYKKVVFIPSKTIDKKYYSLFKMEVIKVLVLAVILISGFAFISPFNIAKKLLNKGHYKDVIKITSIGAKIFPIAQEWYAMRGYANYKLENYEASIKDFDKAYELGAEGFNIMNFDNKIFVKYTLKDYDGAIQDFNKEIEKADNTNERDEFLWDKAQFLFNIKRYDEALDIYNELIEKAENDRIYLLKDRLYYERALVNKQLGKDEEYQLDIEASGLGEDNTPIPQPALMFDDEISEQIN